MKTNFIKTFVLLIMAVLIGAQVADAQKTINRRQTTSTGGGGTVVKPPKKKPVNPMDYITITQLKVGNSNYDGDMLTSYGGTLYSNEMRYATPKITYNCTRAASDVTLYTKIYKPDGSLMTGSSSPSGYTTSDDADFVTGTSNTLELPGWGNNDHSNYPKGTYRWELWYKSKRIFSASFYVYESTTTTTTTGTGGFEYYGTTRSYTDNAAALKYIRETIEEWGDDGCRTGAITEDERGVAIYGSNGYCYTSAVPENMKTAIKEFNNKEYRIVDVTVTDSGWWCVVWGKNGYRGHMPDAMSEAMKKFNNDGEEIWSVSICENGNWSIITNKHWDASHETDKKNLREAAEKFGTIRSCCVTNKGIVICCDRGIYYKDIPTKVEEGIKKQDFRPKFVKFTDSGTYLITDGDKRRGYYM